MLLRDNRHGPVAVGASSGGWKRLTRTETGLTFCTASVAQVPPGYDFVSACPIRELE